MSETLLTVREAANVLGVHPDTVRLHLRSGDLRGTLSSRKRGWRIREDDLHEYIRKHGSDAVRASVVIDSDAMNRAILEELRELRQLLAAAPDTQAVRDWVAKDFPKAMAALERLSEAVDEAPPVALDTDYEREQQQN